MYSHVVILSISFLIEFNLCINQIYLFKKKKVKTLYGIRIIDLSRSENEKKSIKKGKRNKVSEIFS